MKTRESLPRTTSSGSRSGSINDGQVKIQSDSICEDQVTDLCIEDLDQDCPEESNIITDADSTTQNFGLRGSTRSSLQQTRRTSQRSKKSPSVLTTNSTCLVENGVTWIGNSSSILESRLKDDFNGSRTSSSGCKSKITRSNKQQQLTSTTVTTNNNNNNNLKNNNNSPHNLLLLSKDELRKELRRTSFDDDDEESSSLSLLDTEVLEAPLRRGFPSSEVVHLEDRREKKAKVKLKEITRESPPPSPFLLTTLPPLEILEEDNKRRKDDKKEDKNKKKKLKHFEEENLSKRLYESRELSHESRSNFVDQAEVVTIQAAPDSSFTAETTTTSGAEEDRRGVLRLKACGECGARHAGGGCPFTRPTQRLPDSCPLPTITQTAPQNGVIVAPPHRGDTTPTTVNLDETWRNPQRPGSPTCYSRMSLPSSLGLDMRPVPPPQEPDTDDDVGVMGVTTIKPKQVEVVVATKSVAKFTQLGPVVGVPVREKDIPDDFCMINLWEVFGGEGKRYLSTVDPRRSNWTRFLRPAPDRDSANLVMVPRQIRDPGDDVCFLDPMGEPSTQPVESVGGVAVFLVTTQDISPGDELVFWAHDPTLAWSRKKMEKTNCGGCNMRFSHPLFYRMHCSVFHDPNYSLTIRKYHCKVCGLAVLGKENIMRHAAEQHEGRGAYQCQFCKKFFLRLHSLDMHMTYSCGRNPARVFPLCDYCGKKFCQPQHLRSHQKRMHADMAEVLREFQCKLCFKILGSRAALQRHLKEVHHKQDLSTGATCDRCGKMFQNKSNLKIHMLTHSGVKPFRCTESSCNAAFTTKQCLQFHYKKVHGYSGDSMPKIERCIPYTFDSYSGGLVPSPLRGKMSPNMLDNCSTSSNSPEALMQSQVDDLQNDSISQTDDECIEPLPMLKSPSPPPQSRSPELILSSTKLPPAATLHGYVAKYAAAATRLVSKGSRKWLGDSLDSIDREHDGPGPPTPRDIYAFDDRLDSDLLQRRKDKSDNEFEDDKILFRRESNASLLIEAALNVADSNLKGEPRSVGTHDRLLSYAGGGNGSASTRYSPTPSVSSSVDHLLPHDTALSTHIKYTTSTDDERGHLEYTLEREYDPRDLPEVMVVHEGISSRDLNDSLTNDLQEHLQSTMEHLPPAAVDSGLHEVHNVHNLSLAKTEDLAPATPATPSDSATSLSSSNGLEPTLHVLDQLPVSQGMPVSLQSSLAIGLDMTYKHYRLVPESSLAVPHDHLLAGTPMDDPDGSIGLETITSTGVVTCHQMSPRNDHLSDQLPLPELQPHDFRGLPSIRSPEPSRSPYLSPSHTPEEALRSYLVTSESLRSPHSNEHGIDMSRGNVLIRSGDLTGITYRYQAADPVGTSRTQIYEIERPPSQSMDLSVIGRTISYTDVSRSNLGTTVYLTEARPGSGGGTVYLTDQRDDFRQTLDLTIPRSEESISRAGSPVTFNRTESPQASPHHQLSPMNQLSPSNQLPPYSQLSPHNQISSHSHFSPLPQITTLERVDAMSPDLLTRENLSSPGPSTSVSPSIGAPLPPISRIVATSPHSFYSTRQLLSRQDISLPTHIYTDYMITNGSTADTQLQTTTPPLSLSSVDKDRSSSPYLQYPTSPYPRHQEIASPPPGFHYQYY